LIHAMYSHTHVAMLRVVDHDTPQLHATPQPLGAGAGTATPV